MKRCVAMIVFAASAALAFGDDFYTEPQVYQSRPPVDKEMPLDCIGATGIKARFYPGVILKVEGVLPGAPAEGKFKVGQIIAGVNGVELKGINPIVALGKALTAAEASDGKMVFDVKDDENAAAQKVTVTIPVFGKYSETWPLNCGKSKTIIAQAAEYYAQSPEFRKKYFDDKSEEGGIPSALACLFLLSTGDDQYIPVVKEYFANFPKDLIKIGDHTWNNGYNGVACAEYYLRTGDKEVLPILQYYCDNAKERQYFGSGWQHWGRAIHPRYVAGGLMNPAGSQVLTTLLLAKECGVNVDDKTLLGALKFWYRFAGHGTVPYGDHRGEGGLGSNGKDGMAAAAMSIAARAKTGSANYEQAMKYLSMSTLTSYPSLVRGHADEGRGDGIWRGLASAYMLDYEPEAYHAAMNDLTWWYDLSRRPSGALGMATNPRFDEEGSGAGVALAYTAPLKTLQITGAPRSKYAIDFDLPAQIWGNKADQAFLSIENGKDFSKYGKEDPIQVPLYRYGSAYGKTTDLSKVPREDMLKNVFHKRYMIRAQAAKALREVGAFDELETLLTDKDPRVRRAALDGMIDYRYWFHLGKDTIKPDQFTPSMIKAVTGMLNDHEESLYVVDGALSAMSLMPAATIGENLDLIMPWTTHEEWWLRQSAFCALAAVATDEKLVAKVLPTMLDMLVAEDHTMPRDGMVNKLNVLLKQYTVLSPVGQQILTAHMKSVESRAIIPGPRAGEGEWDVQKSAEVLLKEEPDRALELARAAKERAGDFSTGWFVNLVNGLVEASAKAPVEQREEWEALLYGDFRQELIKRMNAGDNDLAVLDAILTLTALKDGNTGWHELGGNHADRVWRFTSIEPQGDDTLHHRDKKRFRAVTLPDALKTWVSPEFDDSTWKEGKAPIGVGEFKKRNVMFKSESEWGDDEFLLARTTFEVDSLDFDYYRVTIMANQGYDIYLNGKKINTYIWWKDDPEYRHNMLDAGAVQLLKRGTNHLAVFAGSDYMKDIHVGQIDVYLEGLKKSDFLGAPEKE